MKTTLLITTLATGLVLTAGCNRSTRTDTAATDAYPADTTTTSSTAATTTTPVTTEPTAAQRMENAAERTGDSIADAGRSASNSIENASRDAASAMRNAGDNISNQMTEWRLSAQELEADLRADREIVRTKSTAGAPTGNVDKSMLKNNVESKVAAHKSSVKDLDVEIDNETEVVLTGEAQSAQHVGQVMAAALSTEGVTKVTSKIKLNR